MSTIKLFLASMLVTSAACGTSQENVPIDAAKKGFLDRYSVRATAGLATLSAAAYGAGSALHKTIDKSWNRPQFMYLSPDKRFFDLNTVKYNTYYSENMRRHYTSQASELLLKLSSMSNLPFRSLFSSIICPSFYLVDRVTLQHALKNPHLDPRDEMKIHREILNQKNFLKNNGLKMAAPAVVAGAFLFTADKYQQYQQGQQDSENKQIEALL